MIPGCIFCAFDENHLKFDALHGGQREPDWVDVIGEDDVVQAAEVAGVHTHGLR